MKIHKQRIQAYKDLIPVPGVIKGTYSETENKNVPIYKSLDTGYNFVDGHGYVKFVKHSR